MAKTYPQESEFVTGILSFYRGRPGRMSSDALKACLTP
jgi:hypothetical protein